MNMWNRKYLVDYNGVDLYSISQMDDIYSKNGDTYMEILFANLDGSFNTLELNTREDLGAFIETLEI